MLRAYPKSEQLKKTIPSRKQRGAITKKEYQRAIEAFGDVCVVCGNPKIEMHHIVFRSQGGRGGYRNLIPLCNKHHRWAHQNREFADRLRKDREKQYGPYFWADKWDLWKAGLIKDATDEEFEKFFEKER